MIWLYLILYISLALLVCFGYWLHYQWKKNYAKTTNPFSNEEITVIIPFRNEAANLQKLLSSLNKLNKFPAEIIFVNDHSEDNSVKILQESTTHFNYTLLHLKDTSLGKKAALRMGISAVNTPYILTWDADIQIPPDYFETISTVNKTDMLILPVRMKASRLLETLYELDYYYLNGISTSISFFSKPIVASGANLLFKKDLFEVVDSYENHQDIASGDDLFLLEDFKHHGKKIEINTTFNLQVETETPHTLDDFINQRLRWISKSQHIGNIHTTVLSILGFIYHIGFYLFFFTDAPWSQLKILVILKIVLDLLVFTPYLFILKRAILIFVVPLFSILYPIYSLLIICMTLFYTPNWKGR